MGSSAWIAAASDIRRLLHELTGKEAELQAEEKRWAEVLEHLQRLENTGEVRQLFERFAKGELTPERLDVLLDQYERRASSQE
jgi:hypothetical protein